jgi:hypothetical protein
MGYGLNEIVTPAENRTPSIFQPLARRYADWANPPSEVKVIKWYNG